VEKKARLDRIDHKILEILRRDGRISYQKLSEQVNLTARPCLERVRGLSATALSAATAHC
jgi:DNA-binding Lrp family transcriptional regulator